MTIRYRAVVSYDGTAYQGFQRQAGDTPTIQLALEQAIAQVARQQATVIGAGRTDTGVHADGQVIAFDITWIHSDHDLLRALNAVLPDDIALQDIVQQPGFHPRFDASSRLYRYTIVHAEQRQPLLSRYTWHVRGRLHVQGMQAAASILIGEHDFATFGASPKGTNTMRKVIRSEWVIEQQPYGSRLTYLVEANAFLQHMVRRIVGMLVDVGQGARTEEQFETAFRAVKLASAWTVAPPQGLFLQEVRYAGSEIAP